MPIVWWINEAEANAGWLGNATARLEQAQSDLAGLIISWGGVILGGIAYFTGPIMGTPPPGGWQPVCVPILGPNVVGISDELDMDCETFDDGTTDPSGGPLLT